MKINLKKVDGAVEWTEGTFRDGETVYWNGRPYIYRKKAGEQAVLDEIKSSR